MASPGAAGLARARIRGRPGLGSHNRRPGGCRSRPSSIRRDRVTIAVFAVLSLMCGAVTALLAAKMDRSPVRWFFAGFLFGVFGMIGTVVAFLDTRKVPVEGTP